jgi:NADPH2:quinone reductase
VKAWRVHELGEPRDVLRLDEVPDPEPGPGQVLVRVLASSVNFPDALLCRGQYQVKPVLPFIAGVELCGEIVGLGDGVTDRAIGQRVIGSPLRGAFCGLTVMDAVATLPAPPALDDAEASSLYISYQTGWFGLHRRAALQAGETLLVHAAAGGVGSAAVQLGKAAGATVIGVVGGADKAQVVRELGADVVVDRRTEDFVAVVKEVTGGRGADVVYDPVGGAYSEPALRSTAWNGRFLVIGFAAGDIPKMPLNLPLLKGCSVVGVFWGAFVAREPERNRKNLEDLVTWWKEGKLHPYVSSTYPLERAGEAIRELADRKAMGKVVVTVKG